MRITIKLVGLMVALSTILIALALASRQRSESRFAPSPEIQAALASITSEELLGYVKVLASDQFEGRSPGSRGEEMTVNCYSRWVIAWRKRTATPNGSRARNLSDSLRRGETAHGDNSSDFEGRKTLCKHSGRTCATARECC